jgi:hypothetical protein
MLKGAAAAAGIDVTDSNFTKALNEAMSTATHGKKALTRKPPRLFNPKFVKPGKKGLRTLEKLKGAGKAIPVVAGIVTGVSLTTAISDPHMRDIATTTANFLATGELSMIDEVFILHDLYMITNDPFAASFGWELWHDVNGL